jgi:hypothetical protein
MNRTTRRGAPPLLVLACLMAGCGGQNDTRPAKWSYISAAIVQPNCATANCHSNLSQRSGVELNDMRTGYYQLVCRNFVSPGRPADSALVGLIKGQGSRRMPPDFALPNDDIDLISAWIMNGAAYDGPGMAPVCPAAPVVTVAPVDAGAGD